MLRWNDGTVNCNNWEQMEEMNGTDADHWGQWCCATSSMWFSTNPATAFWWFMFLGGNWIPSTVKLPGLPDSKCLWICVDLREVFYQRNFSTVVNNGNESKATNSWRSLVILQRSHLTTLRIPSALIASRWCQRCLVFGLMFLSDQMMVTRTWVQEVAKEG